MALRDIRTEGDEALRKKCKQVMNVDDKIRMFLQDLKDTLAVAGGAGLAAPQIGILWRLAVVNTPDGSVCLVNPEITEKGGARSSGGLFKRPRTVGKAYAPQKSKSKSIERKRRRVHDRRRERPCEMPLP